MASGLCEVVKLFGAPSAETRPAKNPVLGFENSEGEMFFGYRGERNGPLSRS